MNDTERIAEINISEAIRIITTTAAKWHPCDKKTKALGTILLELSRLTDELDQKSKELTILAIESEEREKKLAKLEAEVQHWAGAALDAEGA